ncbi:hypothetical protein HETIRDRAFT_414387 [Heterobasidion irregulare TC 32-1]|uniref:Uncharacterized protein n=1 Tax=Heterobasidion irregulare (strain TC 32-1) TaxID=747525 RepID=W4KJZ2_HETIT|nr:uncharacterized protein HETIRDRAFT_414387 [Heterobasidion irregulare TC 32-1]ETW85356.1 hypothetical protein HETIRDRAFT_414387 [Heterobasidion irregulare TC 32-1]
MFQEMSRMRSVFRRETRNYVDQKTPITPSQRRAPASRSGFVPKRVIQTLWANKLAPSDFYDISGHISPVYRAIRFSYGRRLSMRFFYQPDSRHLGPKPPFPSGTHGFLYYVSKTPWLLGGELRFRITKDNNPASFDGGDDLRCPDGEVWCRKLSNLRNFKQIALLRSLINPEDDFDTDLQHSVNPTLSRRCLQTLDPHRLRPSDFQDLSDLNKVRLTVPNPPAGRTRSSDIAYDTRKHAEGHYPTGTHGFFYYLSPVDKLAQGEIRFRITKDDNPANFTSGKDLLLRTGLPWTISMASLLKDTHIVFRHLLLEEKLVPDNYFTNLAASVIRESSSRRAPLRRTTSPILTSFGQQFRFDFSKHTGCVYIKGEHELLYVKFKNPLLYVNSITGFDDGRRGVVIRLNKIVEPLRARPVPEGRKAMQEPVEGQLLTETGAGIKPKWYDMEKKCRFGHAMRTLYVNTAGISGERSLTDP